MIPDFYLVPPFSPLSDAAGET